MFQQIFSKAQKAYTNVRLRRCTAAVGMAQTLCTNLVFAHAWWAIGCIFQRLLRKIGRRFSVFICFLNAAVFRLDSSRQG